MHAAEIQCISTACQGPAGLAELSSAGKSGSEPLLTYGVQKGLEPLEGFDTWTFRKKF